MGWLRKRLQERSTLNGAGLIIAALSIYVGPTNAELIVGAVAGLYGVYEAVRKEKQELPVAAE